MEPRARIEERPILGVAEKPAPRRLWRGLPIVLFVASAVMVVGAWLTAPFLVRWIVEGRARDRGFEAKVGDVRVGFTEVRIAKVEMTAPAIPGAKFDLEDVTAKVSWFQATEVVARHGDIGVKGEWTDLVKLLSLLASRDQKARAIPMRIEDLKLTWSLASGRQIVGVTGARLERSAEQKTSIGSAGIEVLGWKLGAVAAEMTHGDQPLLVGLGASSVGAAPIVVELAPLSDPKEITLKLRETEAPTLVSILMLDGLTAPKAKIEGSAKLSRKEADVWTGAFEGTIRGWSPPVPREVAGLIKGDVKVGGDLRVDGAKRTAAIDKAQASIGALKMLGDVSFSWTEKAAGPVKGSLKGTVGCAAIAQSAVGSQFGGIAGSFAGALAGAAVQGNVAVSVTIDLDPAKRTGKITPEFVIGCRASM